MDCKSFKKLFNDFMDGSLSFSKKLQAEEHLKECEKCRSDFEEELRLDRILTRSFTMDSINFKSQRANVLKLIDANRYSEGFLNKLQFHFKRREGIYAFYAAVLLVFLIVTPYVMGFISTKNNAEDRGSSYVNSSAERETLYMKSVLGSEVEEFQFVVEAQDDNKKKQMVSMAATAWKDSPWENLSVSVDEVNNKILVRDLKSSGSWRIYLYKNTQNYRVKQVEWRDDANILVIAGTSSNPKGGNVYNVQAYKGISYIFYKPEGMDQEIINISRTKENVFILEIAVYEDSSKNKYHVIKKQLEIDGNGNLIKVSNIE